MEEKGDVGFDVEVELICCDSVEAWRNIGFNVDDVERSEGDVDGKGTKYSGVLELPNLRILFREPENGEKKGFVSWNWRGLAKKVDQIGGVKLEPAVTIVRACKGNKASQSHKNGVAAVDHVVLRVSDSNKLKQQLNTFGLNPSRERSDIYPGVRQSFYLLGKRAKRLILELVEISADNAESQQENGLWGITFATATDGHLDSLPTTGSLKVTKVKPAMQKGRRICTLIKGQVNANVAFMSPHRSKL